MNVFELFFSILFAFIVKDVYDVLIRNKIISWLHNYKLYVTREKEIENEIEK